MFDGKIRQRPVSAAGSSKKDTSTKSLVENARKLREHRLEEKQKLNAALKIQSLCKGHETRKKFRKSVFDELQQKLDGIQKIQSLFSSRNQIFHIPVATLIVVIRLLYFSKLATQTNLGIFIRVYQLISESIQCDLPESNFLAGLFDLKSQSTCFHQLINILKTGLNIDDNNSNNNNQLNIINQLNYNILKALFINPNLELAHCNKMEYGNLMYSLICKVSDALCSNLIRQALMMNTLNNQSIHSFLIRLQLTIVISALRRNLSESNQLLSLDNVEYKLWNSVMHKIMTLSNFSSILFMNPLMKFLSDNNNLGWSIVMKIQFTSSQRSDSLTTVLISNFIQSLPSSEKGGFKRLSNESLQQLFLTHTIAAKSAFSTIPVDNATVLDKYSESSMSLESSSTMSVTLFDYIKAIDQVVFVTEPLCTILKLMENPEIIEAQYYPLIVSDQTGNDSKYSMDSPVFDNKLDSNDAVSGVKKLEDIIRQSHRSIRRFESKKFVQNYDNANTVAELLVTLSSNDLLSFTIDNWLSKIEGSLNESETMRTSTVKRTHSALNSSEPSEILYNYNEQLSIPNIEKLFHISNIYLKLFSLACEGYEGDSSKTSNGQNISASSGYILNTKYRHLSVVTTILNTFAFSNPQYPLSRKLWNLIKYPFKSQDSHNILDALIDSSECVIDRIHSLTTDLQLLEGGCNNDALFKNVMDLNSGTLSSFTSSVNYSTALRSAAQFVDTSNHVFCEGLGNMFTLFCQVLCHQLSATDDEEFFDSQQILSMDEIQALAVMLKKFLWRLYSSASSSKNTNLVSISSEISGTGNKAVNTIKSGKDDGVKFSVKSASETSKLLNQKRELWKLCLQRELESAFLQRQYQIYSVTKLFNSLYTRCERRPYLSAKDWQWDGINVIPSDLDKRLQDLSAMTSSQENSQLDMSSLVAQDFHKEVITCIPQVVPFEQRIKIFHSLISVDNSRYQSHSPFISLRESTRIRIQRNAIIEDSYAALAHLSDSKLKGRIQVEFISEQGIPEPGIDGGGLFKAFLDLFMKSAFDPLAGLFIPNSDELLTPNPASGIAVEDHLKYFNFFGKMLGIAVYNRILVEPQFSGGFLNSLLGRMNQIDDLWHLDKSLHHSLMSLKRMAASKGNAGSETEDPISMLGIYFEVNRVNYDMNVTEDLMPNGSSILVKKKNIHSYIHRYANFKLNIETSSQTRAFLAGFRSLILIDWIRMFSPYEMQLLISGEQKPIDIENMRQNVNYGGGYHDNHPYIQDFWKIVSEMTPFQQGCLLKFVTSCSRQPLLGFSQMNPKFGILQVPCYNMDDAMTLDVPLAPRLPSAATCMNLLKLPLYDNAMILKEKLLYAITSDSGFELS